jgi:hypothetical protein
LSEGYYYYLQTIVRDTNSPDKPYQAFTPVIVA